MAVRFSLPDQQGIATQEQIFFHFHHSLQKIYPKFKAWSARFSPSPDNFFFDVFLFYSMVKKKFLDHRSLPHLFRLIISLYALQQRLIRPLAGPSPSRSLAVRCFPTNLHFPFSTQSVLGCTIGFTITDRADFLDEKNLIIALQKRYPTLEYVAESFYQHSSRHDDVKVLYFEMIHKDNTPFSLGEIKAIEVAIQEKIENSIEKNNRSISLRSNDEDLYKSLFILGQEILSIQDPPQVSIKLEHRTEEGVLFLITLVQVAPFHRFSFKERRCGCSFISERILPVKKIDKHLIEARILQAILPINPSLIRRNGALDQHVARRQMAALLENIIGEFRDYNGGLFIKQQETLDAFKHECAGLGEEDHELIESFYYSILPVENKITAAPTLIRDFFAKFLQSRNRELPPGKHYELEIGSIEDHAFFIVQTRDTPALEPLSNLLKDPLVNFSRYIYGVVKVQETDFFCALLMETDLQDPLFQEIQDFLEEWFAKQHKPQVLRIALEGQMFSLDPRIGGASLSADLLRLLSEGLTRFNSKGELENGAAQSIDVSSDARQYTFHLRPSFWNDGSLLTAHDFAYAWKKMLSPHFSTFFATLLYIIENAQEAKEGKVSPDLIGIHVIDDQTLQVKLKSSIPYFLDLLAHPPYFPVKREVDQRFPHWPYQTGKNYPCNGPFQLKMNDPQRGYQLVKNPFYWEAPNVVLDQIMLLPMESSRALYALQRNEVDWIGSPFGDGGLLNFLIWRRMACEPYQHQVVGFTGLSLTRRILSYLIPNYAVHLPLRWIDKGLSPPAPNHSVLLLFHFFPPHCRFSQEIVFPRERRGDGSKLFQEALGRS